MIGMTLGEMMGGEPVEMEDLASPRERTLQALRGAKVSGDPERSHHEADAALCDLLEALGYADVVKAYRDIEKWHA